MDKKVEKLVEYVSSLCNIDEMRDVGMCLVAKAIMLKLDELYGGKL